MEFSTIDKAFDFVRNGASIKQSENSTGLPITRIETIWNSTIDSNRFGYANIEDIGKFENYLLSEGDILMTHINSPKHLGKCAIYKGTPNQLIHGMNLLNLRPNKNVTYSKYVFFYLNSHYFKRQIVAISNQSVNQASFSAGNLKKLKIPLPPLAEQQKIASLLDAADSLRQKDQQLIEHYSALSQSLFLEMFGDPVSNPMGFIKSSVGEQCTVKGGKRIPKGEKLIKEDTGYPYIKAGNIKKGKVTTKNLEYLTPEIREKLKRYIVNEGDVCITVVGVNIGDIGIVPKELHLANLTENANKLLIKNHKSLSNFYLCFSLQLDSIQQQIKKKTMAVGVPKLALFRIQQLELLLPPLDLQNQFAERILAIEAQKQQAQSSLQKSEDLFNSLLQRAFKGELTN